MYRRVISLVIALAACSGHAGSTAVKLATLAENPVAIRGNGKTVVVQTATHESDDAGRPLESTYEVGADGNLHHLGYLPNGPFVVAQDAVYYATRVGGDVYKLTLGRDGAIRLAQHVSDIVSGLALVDGAVIAIGPGPSNGTNRVVRVDLSSGALGAIAPLPPMSDSVVASDMLVAARAGTTFLASLVDGTTIRIDANGAVTAFPSPPGVLDCLAATQSAVWWFRQPSDPNATHELYTAALAGGSAVAVKVELATNKRVGCAANSSDLLYANGHDVMRRRAGGNSERVATAKNGPWQLYADDKAVYWVEEDSASSWSLWSASLQ